MIASIGYWWYFLPMIIVGLGCSGYVYSSYKEGLYMSRGEVLGLILWTVLPFFNIIALLILIMIVIDIEERWYEFRRWLSKPFWRQR